MLMLARLPAVVAAGLVLASAPAQRAPMLAPSTAPIGPMAVPSPVLPPVTGDSLGNIAPRPPACVCAPVPAQPPADPATQGVKVQGRDLKQAIAQVRALDWESDLERAKQRAAAADKPILWLQTLGDLDGFA